MLQRVRNQACANNVRVTQHAQQEMAEEGISLDEYWRQHPNAEEALAMKCSIDGCSGTYESGSVVHTVRHAGQVVVIDHVPAEVCSVCDDVLLKPDTVRRIEVLLQEQQEPTTTVPLYEYA